MSANAKKKPRGLEDLPSELLINIATFLNSADARSLMATSRQLQYPGEAVLYSGISLPKRPTNTLISSTTRSLMRTLEIKSPLARYVQRLYISHWESGLLTAVSDDDRGFLLRAAAKCQSLPSNFHHDLVDALMDGDQQAQMAILFSMLPALQGLRLGMVEIQEDVFEENCDAKCWRIYLTKNLAPEDVAGHPSPNLTSVSWKRCEHSNVKEHDLVYRGSLLEKFFQILPTSRLTNGTRIFNCLVSVVLEGGNAGETLLSQSQRFWEVSMVSNFMRIPSLKTLKIVNAYTSNGARYWNCEAGESNVSDLLILSSYLDTQALLTLIGSCKSLTHFKCDNRNGPRSAAFRVVDFNRHMDWSAVMTALRPSQSTLKSLGLTTGTWGNHAHPLFGPNDNQINLRCLADFPILHWIEFDEVVLFGRTHGTVNNSQRAYDSADIFGFLPTGIERLWLCGEITENVKMRILLQAAKAVQERASLHDVTLTGKSKISVDEIAQVERAYHKIKVEYLERKWKTMLIKKDD